GDVGMYQGATATGTPMIVASGSSVPIQRIAEAADGPRWSQFYPIENLSAARDQIELFQAHGARAIVVTVDQQAAYYERDLYEPSTLEVLPEIVDAVRGRIPVLVDSGFRRGSDLVKAMALGASAVCLGRAPRWGLGAFGPAGVQRLLAIVQAEFRQAMAQTGR